MIGKLMAQAVKLAVAGAKSTAAVTKSAYGTSRRRVKGSIQEFKEELDNSEEYPSCWTVIE